MNDLLSAYVDGALETGEHGRVAEHVERCPNCAAAVAAQLIVRQAIGANREALRDPVPAGLRARVVQITAPARVLPFQVSRPAVARRRWTRYVPASLAAGVLVAFGIGALSPAGTVLAAQLALDHLKCQAIAHVSPGADPVDQARQWELERGWHVDVPASRAELGLSFVGMRNCLYHQGSMAHLMYDYRGHRLSVFVMPQRAASAHDVATLGQQTHTWVVGDRTYALVTDAGAGDLADVAAYVRGAVR